MSKVIIIFLVLISASPGLAQKKLKTQVNKTTGDTLFSTPSEKIYTKPGSKGAVGEYLKTTVHRSSNGLMLGFEIQTGRTSIFTIGKGSIVEIHLQDNSVVELESLNNQESRASALGYGCFLFVYYRLTPKAIRSLESSNVSSIRINASVGPMDYEIKEKYAGDIGKQLSSFH